VGPTCQSLSLHTRPACQRGCHVPCRAAVYPSNALVSAPCHCVLKPGRSRSSLSAAVAFTSHLSAVIPCRWPPSRMYPCRRPCLTVYAVDAAIYTGSSATPPSTPRRLCRRRRHLHRKLGRAAVHHEARMPRRHTTRRAATRTTSCALASHRSHARTGPSWVGPCAAQAA
jgi:hypothetical protein